MPSSFVSELALGRDCGDVSTCVEQNIVWCTGCGAQLGTEVLYVRGYANPQTYKRRQVYSRQKRFRTYVLRVVKTLAEGARLALLKSLDNMLDVYSLIEFAWQSGVNSERKYFYAKPVMLYVCASLVGIETDELPCLKDKTRESAQYKEIAAIIEEPHTKLCLEHLG